MVNRDTKFVQLKLNIYMSRLSYNFFIYIYIYTTLTQKNILYQIMKLYDDKKEEKII